MTCLLAIPKLKANLVNQASWEAKAKECIHHTCSTVEVTSQEEEEAEAKEVVWAEVATSNIISK